MKKKPFQELSIEDKLFVLQMAAEIFNDPEPMTEVDEEKSSPLMAFARKIAASIIGDGKTKEAGIDLIALNSTTEVVAKFENVLVKTPAQPNGSPSRFILAYLPDLQKIDVLEVPSHSYFGYVMKRQADDKVKPTVTMHFYDVPDEKIGKTVIANVTIKLQKDVRSDNKKMVIDVAFNPNATKNNWTMAMDILPADHSNEFSIPEMPEKCVRIKPVLRKNKYLTTIDIAPIACMRETVNV